MEDNIYRTDGCDCSEWSREYKARGMASHVWWPVHFREDPGLRTVESRARVSMSRTGRG